MVIHKVKIVRISPKRLNLCALEKQGAFLGISLSNPVTGGDKLPILLSWATSHFHQLQVVIGDYVERHNYLSDGARSESDAAEIAMAKAAPIRDRIEKEAAALKCGAIQVISSREMFLSSQFDQAHGILEEHFLHNDDFKRFVMTDIYAYLNRRLKRGELKELNESRISNSVSYILEELAMFSLLVSSGFTVQLYPGQHLNILTALANHELMFPTSRLNELVCVDLCVS